MNNKKYNLSKKCMLTYVVEMYTVKYSDRRNYEYLRKAGF